jgi:hypothetical protein
MMIVILFVGFCVWTLSYVKPLAGYSPDLLDSVSTLLDKVGWVIVAAIGGRAVKAFADNGTLPWKKKKSDSEDSTDIPSLPHN